MKSAIKYLVDATVLRLVNYVLANAKWTQPGVSLTREVERMAIEESALYATTKMQKALYFRTKERLWPFIFDKVDFGGLFGEFGVHQAYSLNAFARAIRRKGKTIYGFDSFEGLKEDWAGSTLKKGHFDLKGKLPKVESNAVLIKGWFDCSVPHFLSQHSEHFSFIHVDCDTYESTKTLLEMLSDRIKSGCIIIFDEYFGYIGWKLGEYKAWQEFVAARRISYEYIAFSEIQAAVRVI